MTLTAYRQDRAFRGPRGSSDGWRMGFHLMPPVGRMGRPRLVCQDKQGRYHVFFEYDPSWPRPAAGSRSSAMPGSPGRQRPSSEQGPFSAGQHSGTNQRQACKPQPRPSSGWGHYASPNLIYWSFEGMATLDDIPENIQTLDLSAIQAGGPLDAGFGFSSPAACVDHEGRTLLWGLMREPETRCATPLRGRRWSGCLTVPREVTRDEDGSLRCWPVPEIDELRTYPLSIDPAAGCLAPLHRADILLEGIQGDHLEARLDKDLVLAWRQDQGLLTLRFAKPAPVGARDETASCRLDMLTDLRILIDGSAVEVYADQGRAVLSTRWFPTTDSLVLYLDAPCAKARAWLMADGMDGTYPDWGPAR